MEPIIIWRGEIALDEDDNPITSDPEPIHELRGLYAPNNPSETAEVGRNAVIEAGTVYVRTADEPDILGSDLVEVRSPAAEDASIEDRRQYLREIDGEVGDWISVRGVRKGYQFAVKAVRG